MEKFFNDNKSNRRFLCNIYDIQIIRRYRLIPGQNVNGIYKNIEDLVYEFRAQNKKYPNNPPFFFHTGRPTGEEFIQFANITTIPPIFNLLQNNGQLGGGGGNHDGGINQQDLDPNNREMVTLCSIFFYLHGLDVENVVFKIYSNIITDPLVFKPSYLKSLNTIIYYKFGMNIQQLLINATLKVRAHNQNANLANFTFNHLTNYCKHNNFLPPPSLFF
jgi:hypothetical protein